ncbi:hypothetical protein TEA_012856 [Camellia sinensis var. sinensis]|uniref:WW domain-containing protein n=1 Tax=Camellia sinensis var. sinensis TaxID=542762 RepID=A0A4S4EKC4_CAMSN|nr:hypothetical protein TEA_012856 [Camellia sinensis var. sinensis]
MGKRKERRIAAMIAAGRRVKLDLFAEPSGDSGGSSAQDELGGDIDPRHRAGSPNSPSSSGKQSENPLLLLGQYSDDELDEESSKRLDDVTAEKSTAEDDDEQVKGSVGTENEDMENNASMELDADKERRHDLETGSVSPDPLQNREDNDVREIDSAVTADLCKVVSTEEASITGTSDVHLTGDVISSWKVVLHEESNQYYYWNTVTGETSWAGPDLLAQGAELTGEQKTAPDTEVRNGPLGGTHEPNSTLDMELDGSVTVHPNNHCKAGNVIHETREIDEPEAQIEDQNDGFKDKGLEDKRPGSDANQTEMKNSSNAALALYSLGDSVSSQDLGDTLLCNGDATDADQSMVHEEDDTENDLSFSVLKHSEQLLERLKSLKGSKSHMQGHEWISKFLLEVEIRLSDIKSLLPFGSSLLPFWVHCERHLKELEGAIDNEVSLLFKSADSTKIREAEAPHNSWESEGNEIDADGNEKKVVSSSFDLPSADVYVTVSQKDSKNEVANNDVLQAEHVSVIDYPTAHSGSGVGGSSGVHGVAQPTELTSNIVLHGGEDVDMDVDMEVEDATPENATITIDSLAAKYCAPEEQTIQPNPPAEHESFVLPEAFGVPPPPDDDWIPPPPPDNESFPPPPPDDPPELSYPPPPTYFETVQPVSYTEQYNLSYPASNFEYYGQSTTEFPANNVYGHTEGFQVAVSHPPLYYEALPSTYPVAAPVVVNPVEPVVYCDVQDGAVLPGPAVSGAQSLVSHGISSHEVLGSDQISSVESHAEAHSTSLLNAEVGLSVSTDIASLEVPFMPATIQAPVTVSAVESAPGLSTTAVTAATAVAKSTATNVQSKVPHSKKRTVAVVSTLRSNKKVSSLVDKVLPLFTKEKLQEDEEDEPENAYEILEKKRQREIEEWRAQQIASGEARANANFQPLGGDWRERVKRKRAQLNKVAVQTPSEAVTNGNQQPDLKEFSRDLPSGWQAYWDESSKQVYYGNSITSETTWTKPTK